MSNIKLPLPKRWKGKQLYLAAAPPFPTVVRLLAIAAKVSSRDTSDAASDEFIKFGSLTLLLVNAGLDAMLDVDVVVDCDTVHDSSL